MKKFYTKMMALACMFLLVGANAWASEKWVAYNGSTQVSVTISTTYQQTFVSNLQAKADAQITYSHQNTTGSPENYVGVPVATTNKLYLKPTTAGYVNLRLNCSTSSSATVTIYDSTIGENVASLNVTVTPRTNTDTHGDIVLFEVVANHEYEIRATGKYYLLRVNKYESSEVATINDEMDATAMQSAIGSGKTIVKMNRALKAGVWNTFCSPIELGTSAVKKELKCNKVYVLDKYESNTITFKESKGEDGEPRIEAGVPCIIMPTEAVSGISISNSEHPATYNPQTITSGNLSFVAALASTNIYDANHTNYFVSNNTLKYPSTEANGTIKGMRAYFHLANGATVKDFAFEDDATGIICVETDPFEENANVYTIDGRNMGNAKNLSRGIYVQNGRKFIVK
jgi:hypothetical protein